MAIELKIFSLKWYLDHNSDVAAAVAQGLVDAFQHFEQYGKAEGRSMGPLFDVDLYLEQNPDVAAAVARGETTAYDHFMQYGGGEGRAPSALFDEAFYLLQNPDVAAAVQAGAMTAVQHFLAYGQSEPRPFNPSIDLGAYLQANPDIAEAVQNGFISAMEHLMVYGAGEARDLGNGVNLGVFANDSTFQQALSSGDITGALQRVGEVAPFLPTFQSPAGWTPPPDTPIPLDFVPPEGLQLVIPPTVVVPPDVVLPPVFTPPAPPGPTPGGGGGGGTTFTVTVDGGVVEFGGNATGNISMTVEDDVVVFSGGGIRVATELKLSADSTFEIHVSKNQKLTVVGSVLDEKGVKFSGDGLVDIKDITIAESSVSEGVSNFAKVNVDLSKVLLPNIDDRIAMGDTTPIILVNGTEVDFIKASWVYFDQKYYSGWPDAWENYYNTPLNEAKANLALLYVSYLEKGGSPDPFLSFVAKTAVSAGQQTRSQSVHDNILGELTSAALRDRGLIEEYGKLAGAYTERPWIDGVYSNAYINNHKEALRFDYDKGWVRGDYIRNFVGVIDETAVNEVNGVDQLYFGSGNTVTNFSIARHEGAGIELALKAKLRLGPDEYKPDASDGIPVYTVPSGAGNVASWGSPAAWSFDFSVATGLNKSGQKLDGFDFILSVDVDPSENKDFIQFKLLKENEADPGSRAWVLLQKNGSYDFTAGFDYAQKTYADVNELVSQNSVNLGFDFIKEKLPQDYVFGEGEFDIRLDAYDIESGLKVIGNQIKVLVEEHLPA
ncbi:hypothetical protein H0A70_14770 [Alcaligenaceae bacterium]|nr:hypothetical protein [Alcaligenaceae bacterium]